MNTDGTSQDTGSNGLSEADAADRIADLLTPPGDSGDGETPRKPKAKAEEASDLDEDDAPADEADDDAEDEEQSEEGEGTEDDEEEPAKFTVKIDGQDVEVTLDELQRGYSRTQDYTRKTMELAEARKALEPERQALREERDQYANLLPRLYAFLTNQVESPELEQLRHTDPGEWAARKHELERQQAAVRLEHDRVAQERALEAQRELQETAKREAKALLEAEPAFGQPGVFEEARAYALQSGFSAEDVDETLPHQAWIIVRKAMEYDRLKAKAPQTKAKVDAVKTAKPGTTARQPSKVTELTRAKQRLAKTGRVEDAQTAIERLLG